MAPERVNAQWELDLRRARGTKKPAKLAWRAQSCSKVSAITYSRPVGLPSAVWA